MEAPELFELVERFEKRVSATRPTAGLTGSTPALRRRHRSPRSSAAPASDSSKLALSQGLPL